VDKASVGGVLLGLVGIIGGLLLEGGTISQILQPTAAMIVFGGTAGAILVQFPLSVVLTAVGRLAAIFSEPQVSLESVIEQLVSYANMARRRGIASLDDELHNVHDAFMKKVLTLAVDGTEPQELRKIAELDLDNELEREERFPQVFESAGGSRQPWGSSARCLG
jgi:chemotaxis protein MotA